MSLSEFVQSPAYKKIMAYVYGFGAAVAISGSLFKIMHFPGAGVMLVAGLGVEALIFALSSFEPPHEIPDWSLVYPELIGLEPEDKGSRHSGGNGNGGGSELAALVSAGAIEQKTIDQLSDGVKRLANTTSQMADLSDASSATKAYISNVKSASDSLNQFTAIQTSASEVGGKLTASCAKFSDSLSESGAKLNSSISETCSKIQSSVVDSCTKLSNSFESQAAQSEQLGKSIGAVSAAYQAQLNGLNNQLKSSESLSQGLSAISSEIAASVDGVKQYRAQLANLSKTVGELNSIYGNMLSAVTNR